MRYAGDTPAKKIARLLIWTRIKELLGPRFYTGTHVVLLSPWAGDVSTLKGMGVAMHKIVGVDIDKHAVAAAQHKFPELRCLNEDVIAALERLKKEQVKVASVFLDFCAPLRNETIGKAVESTLYLQPDGVLAFAAKIGREQGDHSEVIRIMKSRSAIGRRTRTKSRALHMRAEHLTKELSRLSKGYRHKPLPINFYRYRSFKGDDKRSEMFICLATLRPQIPLPKKIIKSATFIAVDADHKTVGAEASRLAQAGALAHLLLNLKPESIPAYKAHLTRGSYDGVISPSLWRRI